MKIVQEIRNGIQTIPGAMVDAPSELGAEGEAEGRVRSVILWDDVGDQLAFANRVPLDEDDIYERDFPQIEEMIEFGAELDMGRVKRRSVLTRGVDALAYYCSFHQRGRQWGIYVNATGVLYLSATVFDHLPVDLNTKLQISFRALHQHELFHFAVDYMVSQWEAILDKACYVPARQRLRDPAAGYIVREEELANAHMIRAMRGGHRQLRVRARTESLRRFVQTQPAGYKDGGNSTSQEVFQRRSNQLAREHLGCIEGYSARLLGSVDLFRLFPIDAAIDWRYCPIHVVHDEHRLAASPLALGLFQSVLVAEETSSFVRKFEKLPDHIQRRWLETKQRMAQTVALPGLDFKRWRNGSDGKVYSVRLNKSYRAHLQYGGKPPGWSAIEIGTHQELGHG
jgi:hypothetical protein